MATNQWCIHLAQFDNLARVEGRLLEGVYIRHFVVELFMIMLTTFDWDAVKIDVLKLIIAVLLGALIGSESSRCGRAAEMRTHILVCLDACMTSMKQYVCV